MRKAIEWAALAAGLLVAAFVGCGNDVTETGGPTGDAGGPASSSSHASASVSAVASSSTGGVANCNTNPECEIPKEDCTCAECLDTALCNPDQCKTDGVCDFNDSCICPDCDVDPAHYCDNPDNCDHNGDCDSFNEGCVCDDCWTKDECKDNPMTGGAGGTGQGGGGNKGGAGGA